MSYYFSKTLQTDFPHAVERVTEALKQQGFGIITEIDVKDTFKKKTAADFRNYRILGACNPSMAHEALLLEEKIGTMLPCNVVVQELAERQGRNRGARPGRSNGGGRQSAIETNGTADAHHAAAGCCAPLTI